MLVVCVVSGFKTAQVLDSKTATAQSLAGPGVASAPKTL